jgi:disulfide bond formation protein DsbB
MENKMSEYQKAQSPTQLNANLVAFIFIFTFTITGIFIVSNMRPHAPQGQEGASVEVALAESTASVVPSPTPLLPTVTPSSIPTSTPVLAATTAPTMAAVNLTAQTAADAGQASGANTTVNYDPALVTKGQQLFLTCSACHGPDARGLPKLGKNLIESEFVHSLNDQDLLTFVKTGRPSWDALNTTGIDMPPKGGNPAFTDEDILAIIAYIRTLSASGG